MLLWRIAKPSTHPKLPSQQPVAQVAKNHVWFGSKPNVVWRETTRVSEQNHVWFFQEARVPFLREKNLLPVCSP